MQEQPGNEGAAKTTTRRWKQMLGGAPQSGSGK
jgi:hypothetical protein